MDYNKEYYEKNKEHIKELVRKKYIEKKDIINKKVICPVCNRKVIGRMYKKHLTTNIHNKPPPVILPKKEIITKKIINNNNGWVYFN